MSVLGSTLSDSVRRMLKTGMGVVLNLSVQAYWNASTAPAPLGGCVWLVLLPNASSMSSLSP